MGEQSAAGRTAVVVGVGPGLGLALVDAFAGDGYTVVAAGRSAAVESFPYAASDRVVPCRCDATRPDDVQRLFAVAAERGALGVAVFNAAGFERSDVADIDPDVFERSWRIGCFAGFLVGRAAARRLLQQDSGGTILFTGATASLRGGAGFGAFASPKFALRALAQSMARELSPRGIHVAHVIIDGQIRSPRHEALLAQRGPDSLLEPAAIAASYLALHHQPRSAWTHELELRPWVEPF